MPVHSNIGLSFQGALEPLESTYRTSLPGTDFEKVSYLRNLFVAARDAKRARYDSWLRNYRLVHNRISGSTYTSWAPQPRDSEIFPILSNWVGWMTDQKPEIVFFPAAEPFSQFYQWITKISADLTNLYATNYDAEDYE